jgi:DNA-binding CsgD family transcriptional regulator
MHIGRDAATTDRWDDAESAYAEGIRLARETGQTTDLAMSLGGLAMLQARRGSAESCVAGAAEAEAMARAHHIRMASFWATFALGDLAAGRGEVDAAVGHYERLTALLASTGFADPDQACGPELVECYLQLGRPEEAGAAAEEFLARALGKGQPWALARAQRALGMCSSGSALETHFAQALALHAQTPDGYERARTELAFGSRLRRDRRRVEARPLLRSALATFERLGAAPWADRAAQELQATGETVHRHAVDGHEELTPQERQIAQLLASGRTTREAAAALFISPKTVEYHLRHVYLKLDIRSRAELAEVLVR